MGGWIYRPSFEAGWLVIASHLGDAGQGEPSLYPHFERKGANDLPVLQQQGVRKRRYFNTKKFPHERLNDGGLMESRADEGAVRARPVLEQRQPFGS